MSDHPYHHLPDTAFWRRSVAVADGQMLPFAKDFLRLEPHHRIASAGSCFAQHIARHLAAMGFHYLVTETAHPIVPPGAAADAGYGLYTARYGNIYTTLQLLQLFERAYGRFKPEEGWWRNRAGRVVDPFRPTVQPGGFASEDEAAADREHHLAMVRQSFETLDVLVFTLGLTEGWLSRADGAAFPICPGVAGGQFDANAYRFHNLRVAEVVDQLGRFVSLLRSVNPNARLLLTVSPVPLVATASSNHVLPATIYSKSVLRAAAQEIAEDISGVYYFASYEIITGPQARGQFFADDLREVTEAGVARVMAAFLAQTTGGGPMLSSTEPRPPHATPAGAAAGWVETMCDEAMLDEKAE